MSVALTLSRLLVDPYVCIGQSVGTIGLRQFLPHGRVLPANTVTGHRSSQAHRRAQLLAQAGERLGPDLRYARLGEIQNGRDLVELELLEVVEGQHRALLLLEPQDRVAYELHFLLAA